MCQFVQICYFNFKMSAKTLLALAAIVLGMETASANPIAFHRLRNDDVKSQRRFGESDCVYGFYGHNCGSGIDFGFVGNVIDAFTNAYYPTNGSNLRLFIALLTPTTTLAPAYEIHPLHSHVQRRWTLQAG